MISLLGLDPATYERHALHGTDRSYPESNCYADVIVELLHARGLEPLAVMGHLVRMDFEGDQWTFFKPPPQDLERLYGVDVHEMQPYRPLAVQAAEQIEQGRTLIVELDSWWLPDTAATAYRSEHVKSSVAIEAVDAEGERLRYFHGPGYHELAGEDFREVLEIRGLPPYTEIARFDLAAPLEGEALRAAARELLGRHLALRPRANPFTAFGAQLERALPELLVGEAADYHAYAFATVRLAGAAFEILASHAEWLAGAEAAAPAAGELRAIVDGSKVLSFKLARRRAFEPAAAVEALSGHWARAMEGLEALAD